jgi:uncharacterized membrane protein YciS (DUF1049 family)
VLTISAFYALPALQLVYHWSAQAASGSQDVCYYNYLCARPLGSIYAFNAVFSNIGYVFAGVLFCAIVFVRSHYTRQLLNDDKQIVQAVMHVSVLAGSKYRVFA